MRVLKDTYLRTLHENSLLSVEEMYIEICMVTETGRNGVFRVFDG